MLETTHDSFEEGDEGKFKYTATGLNLDDFFDFDGATLDNWIDPGMINAPQVTKQLQQDSTDMAFPFDFLSKGSDLSKSRLPHTSSSKPPLTGPTPSDDPLKPMGTRPEEHTADTNNKIQPNFTVFAMWDPNTGLNADDEDKKTTKKCKLSSTSHRRKSRTSDDRLRKRAPNGTICVRCRLQKGKVCWPMPIE
jgi:hypothetical protein